MKVGVLGAGHVGLPTAAVLANLGHDVAVTDSDAEKIAMLERGVMPFFEPGLAESVRAGVEAGRLVFFAEPAPAIAGAALVFICVGTPPRATGEANLAALERAAGLIAGHATTDVVVVQKSTVPTGTASRLADHMRRINPSISIRLVSNPEFLREGRAVADSRAPDRILVGSDSQEALATMRDLYRPLLDAGIPLLETDVATAEMAKHASNAFLATKISFANALARLCELAGADVTAVADAMGADPRIGRDFLDAGLGYGGYCLPKDVASFERVAARLGYDFALLREVARINDDAIGAALAKVEQQVWNLEGKRVALLGLAFKPGTDDVRLSPALELGRRLLDAGAQVVGYDPKAGAGAKAELPALEVVDDVYLALQGAHCAVVCTAWPEFAELDVSRAAAAMETPFIVDGRNALDGAALAAAGFTYLPTGRPARRPR